MQVKSQRGVRKEWNLCNYYDDSKEVYGLCKTEKAPEGVRSGKDAGMMRTA
jgi:hypothetical protein